MPSMQEPMTLKVIEWSAWSPSLTNRSAWLTWEGGPLPRDEEQSPPATQLPAMLRRRCSRLSKMALHVAEQAIKKVDAGINFALFCSRHGELHRTVQLLQQIVSNDELSPMAFAQSVHNTSSGLFGIANKMPIPTNSIAATHYLTEQGWIEAFAYLQKHPSHRLLMIVFDETIPFQYSQYTPNYADIAFALVLTSAQHSDAGQLVSLIANTGTDTSSDTHSSHDDETNSSPWRFMRKLVSQKVATKSNRWHWDMQC